MLTSLSIQNYILIRELEVNFNAGLTTLTGETGAGKSILLGALGLILGNRAESNLLQDDTKKCVIEGTFNLPQNTFADFFTTHELDWDSPTIIRREIAPGGKSRAFINDSPVTISVLKELGEELVDIHSQHQTLLLASPQFQLSLVDAQAGHKKQIAEYAEVFSQYTKTKKELALLEEKVANARKEYDYNIFQLTEIDSLNPVAGEFQKLEEDFSLLSNAEAIGAVLTELVFSVYDDENSIYNRLNILRKQLSALATNPSLKELAAKMETIIAEVKDLYHEADEINGTVGSDSMSLEVLTQRLNTYNNILHKHGFKTDAELLNFSTELKEKVNRIEDFGNEIKLLTHHQKEQKDALTALAKTLTANRKKIIPTLEKELATMLKELGIPDAVVQINLLPLENFNEFGLDKAAIFFSANKGMQPAPVADAASGGELSRLMLCFKYLLADSALLPTIIFDEIDSGISGEIALRVGNMLKKLSRKHQVLAITHLPQIAAIGNQHLLVFKQTEKGSTQTSLRPLSATDRIHEIAKMIAGNNPSNINIATAKELLGE